MSLLLGSQLRPMLKLCLYLSRLLVIILCTMQTVTGPLHFGYAIISLWLLHYILCIVSA